MHEYYAKNTPKLKKAMKALLKPIAGELEQIGGKAFAAIFSEIWEHYEKNMLENFPYIGGDEVSGTRNLTGAYCFVSMGEVLKTYGVGTEEIGHLMVLAYERRFSALPGIVKTIAHKSYTNVRSLNKSSRRRMRKTQQMRRDIREASKPKPCFRRKRATISAITIWSARLPTLQGPMAMRHICRICATWTTSCSAYLAFPCSESTPALRTATTATSS